MGTLPEGWRNASTFNPSTTKRIQEVKNWLVLEVATRSGTFWEEVCKTRVRWDVQAPTRLPPEDTNLQPDRLHRMETEDPEQYVYDSHNWHRDVGRLSSWLAIPGLERYREDVDWRPLMSALVLYQPPLDKLQEFAEYGGIARRAPEYERDEPATGYDPVLVEPLIQELQHPYAVEWACRRYYETLMEQINERFLKPRGLDIQKLKAEVLKDGALEEDVEERTSQLPRALYVEVPEEPSVDELRVAVGLAASRREALKEAHRPSSKASKTLLMQVELAYRHYRLGEGFLDVSDRYRPNIKSSETFKRYALAGRAYLPTEAQHRG
jgi:hypothetical protein